jgi:hypothetical protein
MLTIDYENFATGDVSRLLSSLAISDQAAQSLRAMRVFDALFQRFICGVEVFCVKTGLRHGIFD